MRKQWSLILLGGILLGVLVLASGLTRSQLPESQPFRLEEKVEQITGLPDGGSFTQRTAFLVRGLFLFFLLFFPLYLIISLLTQRGRKRLVNDLIRLAAFLLFLYWLDRQSPRVTEGFEKMTELPMQMEEAMPNPQAPLAVFDPGQAPQWLTISLLVGAMLFLVLLVGVVAWWWYLPDRRKGKAEGPNTRQQLAEQAETAIEAIEGGSDLKNVILFAYFEMARILAEARGLERAPSMTPAEFAQALERQGLPAGAVRDLTRLFEQVRYGSYSSGTEMETRALNALRAIQVSVV